jgi:threonylcarbamoyladenosine tRNA methylthiotransferase MtaB
MKKFYIHTLGCKLNFAESSKLKQDFEKLNCEETKNIEEADYIVVNTCSVTASADKKGRYILNHARRQNPTAKIIATGCYSQLKPEKIKELNSVDLILGNEEKANFAKFVSKISDDESKTFRKDYKDIHAFAHAYSFGDRTRTFLKIQDGCNYFCAYCTIPMARGESRSDTIANVIQNFRDIEAKGIKEVVLTGINIGEFGKKHGETLYELFQAVEKEKFKLRIRISSIEPNLLTNEIVDLVANSKIFMPHFHVPLQCATDRLLKKMGRRYDTNLFIEKISYIKKQVPNAFIGVDLISGVPHETEDDFNKTCEFVKNLDVSELHVFTYSERDNTRAKKMEEQVPVEIRKKRSLILQEISKNKLNDFYTKFKGQKFEALFEHKNDGGKITGYTENYIKVSTKYDESLVGKIRKIRYFSDEKIELDPL